MAKKISVLRIGARSSRLSQAQVNIVQNIIKSKIGINSEFNPINSLGDLNTSIPIDQIAKEGVFTSTLESALLKNDVDIAIHSFKDLPTENQEELKIVAVLKRQNSSDSLIIRKDKIIIKTKKKFIMKKGTRIGTGSARRQSQLLHMYPNITPIDIRGNVETRIKKLVNGQYDAIVMASVVFQRLNLIIPEKFIKIELDQLIFPTAPAQGAICIQMKQGNKFYDQIKLINDVSTRKTVEMERKILQKIGCGCQLPLGLNITKNNDLWDLILTLAPNDWRNYAKTPLTRLKFSSHSLNELFDRTLDFLPNVGKFNQYDLEKKDIILIGSSETTKKYEDLLINLHAYVRNIDLQHIYDTFTDEQINTFSDKWLSSDWVILTSKSGVNALNRLNRLFPKNNLKCNSIGSGTTKFLQKNGYAVHFQAESSSSLSLIEGIRKFITREDKLFYISAKNAKKELYDYFVKEGYNITNFIAYDSSKINKPPILSSYEFAVIFSPNYAKIAFEIYGEDLAKKWVAIGDSTEKQLQNLGMKNIIKPEQLSPKGLVEVLL